MKDMIAGFLSSNTTAARVARTLIQGIVSVLIVAIPATIGDPDVSTIPGAAVALVMALLSAVMGAFSKNSEEESEEE